MPQPDGDCPGFGLCCFDGCVDSCGEVEVEARAAPQPTEPPGYEYTAPEVTLPLRTTPRPATTTTELELLYNAPRQGRARQDNR